MFTKRIASVAVLAFALIVFPYIGASDAYAVIGRQRSVGTGMNGMGGMRGMGGAMSGMSRMPAKKSLKGVGKGLPKSGGKTKSAGAPRRGR